MNLAQATHTESRVPPEILLMEDEPSIARGLENVLTEEGYSVDVAMTGRNAMEKIHQKPFDLFVADLRLPDMDGMDVIRRMKEEQPKTEVVVITGYSTVSSAVEAMKTGVYDYLPKPFTEDEFKTAVDGALKKKGETEATSLREMKWAVEEEEKVIQKREVIRALNRTYEDPEFWRDLTELGSEALGEYRLSPEAKAAIASGDLKWINEEVGELTQKQLKFIYRVLERECW
ncbi:MAG: response regulator [Syntrophobacteraceae bacterium]|nr:response regulator [Syntrophobacteraceae bacterium]